MGKRETNRGFSSSQVTSAVLNNITTEVVLFSEVIPAGKMGTGKKLTLKSLATITTPLLSLPSLTIKIKLGSAVLTLANAVALASSQTNSPVIIEATIRNRDAANAQMAFGRLSQNGNNLVMLLANSTAVFDDTWTVDTTVDQTLQVTAQFGALSGTTSFQLRDTDMDLS